MTRLLRWLRRDGRNPPPTDDCDVQNRDRPFEAAYHVGNEDGGAELDDRSIAGAIDDTAIKEGDRGVDQIAAHTA